jgi:hypothetical protein
MLRDILWAVEAKMSYDRGKETGIWGLVGIGLVILAAAYWETILYPFFKFIGVVSIAEKLGLVSEYGGITALNIVAAIVIFYILALLMIVVIGGPILSLIYLFSQDSIIAKSIKGLLKLIALLLASPFFIIAFMISLLTNPKGIYEKAKNRRKAAFNKRNYIANQIKEYINRDSVELTKEEISERLNRLFMKDDKDYLIGYSKAYSKYERDAMYVILPSPLFGKGKYHQYSELHITHPGVYLDNLSYGELPSEQLACIQIDFLNEGLDDLKIDKNSLNEGNSGKPNIRVGFLSYNYFDKIVYKKDSHIDKLFKEINENSGYQYFYNGFNKHYIYKRELCRIGMKYFSREVFHDHKIRFEKLNARHSEVFELMYDREQLELDVINEYKLDINKIKESYT